MKLPCWDSSYPDRRVLKAEVESMVQAIVEALLQEVPESEIAGIYLKGSAKKEWDSPLDYVPELSDVDVHVLFRDESVLSARVGTVEQALRLQGAMEAKYRCRQPDPVHVPRPQIIVLNRLMADEDFVPSPPETIEVLHGKPYPKLDLSNPDRIRSIDCKRLLEEEQHIAAWPLRIIDKPCRYLWEGLRGLVWQVSPIGPRVAHLLGAITEEAWSGNRTHIIRRLQALGENELADDYVRFYLAGWGYFLSGYADTEAGRLAFLSGVNVIRRGVQIARSWQAEHSTEKG